MEDIDIEEEVDIGEFELRSLLYKLDVEQEISAVFKSEQGFQLWV